ncbi:hypothetical protein DN730_03135 [Marinomonas piezotolerans]|uniref:UmuC domain-containing protein n=1 Tax=Marinomonas piezotolerans TaxID=2213058 RepID=A0A370UE41_9GAMM|nr:DNA polymerase Y family protein [Marinomonas piezotolerans]RDL46050.1 hypothetical protein DN730_03135 [Marinomonas piezotolerans]
MWLAISCPCIEMDALSVMGVEAPFVVAQKHDSKVSQANDAAKSLGVNPGIPLTLAFTLAPTLEVLSSDAKQTKALLESLAQSLGEFSGTVSIRPPDCVVIEVKSMLKYFGSLQSIARSVRSCAKDWVSHHNLALGPTALLAQWRSQAGDQYDLIVNEKLTEVPIPLIQWLDKVPLSATRWDKKQLSRLSGLGLKTLDELYRLPSVLIRKHLGDGLYQQFGKAIGTIVEPIDVYQMPESFHREIEFDREVEHSLGLIFPLKNVTQALSTFLRRHRQKLYELTIKLTPAWTIEDQASEITLEIKHDLGSDDASLWLELIELKLSTLCLPAPIRTMVVFSGSLEASIESNQDLFDTVANDRQSAALFISRIQARLGEDVIKSPSITGEHLPEHYAEYVPVVATDVIKQPYTQSKLPSSPHTCSRPQWLLVCPTQIDSSQFRVIEGPERVSTAWWKNRGQLERRDYYKVLWGDQRIAWVFRNDKGHWYLHGWFS